MTGFLDIDDLLAAHIAVALRNHVDNLRRQQQPAPVALIEIGSDFAKRARRGHTGTALDAIQQLTDAAGKAPHLLTYDQVAHQLACSDRTVKRLAQSGELHTVQIAGGLVRVRAEDLDNYVAGLSPRRDTTTGDTA